MALIIAPAATPPRMPAPMAQPTQSAFAGAGATMAAMPMPAAPTSAINDNTSDPLGHIRLYEAGNTYDMPPALAHAAAKRDLVAAQRPVDWEPPSILRPPEVLTEAELAAAEAELKALQRQAFEVVDPESR